MDLREFWIGRIVNMEDGFTMKDLLLCKEKITQKDMKVINEIFKDLGDNCMITRKNNTFYILKNPLLQ